MILPYVIYQLHVHLVYGLSFHGFPPAGTIADKNSFQTANLDTLQLLPILTQFDNLIDTLIIRNLQLIFLCNFRCDESVCPDQQ